MYTEEKFGHSVTESAIALCPEMQLRQKLTATKVRALKRKRDRQIRDQENAVLTQLIPRQILGSSTASVSSYLQRRRREQGFERSTQRGKTKSHSPSDTTHWDVPAAMAMLQNWQADNRIWSAEAQKLGIPGANRGQVLKEVAQRHGIDTVTSDGRSSQRIHARKWRFPGSDISVGCGPSQKALLRIWAEMVQSG